MAAACLAALCCPLTIACVMVCRGRRWCCFRGGLCTGHKRLPNEPDSTDSNGLPDGDLTRGISSLRRDRWRPGQISYSICRWRGEKQTAAATQCVCAREELCV